MDEMAGVLFAFLILGEKELIRRSTGATIVDAMTTMVGCNSVLFEFQTYTNRFRKHIMGLEVSCCCYLHRLPLSLFRTSSLRLWALLPISTLASLKPQTLSGIQMFHLISYLPS